MLGEESETPLSQNRPPDKFFNPGSTISLKCIIRRHLIMNATVNEITNVTWKKNKVPIDLQMQERIRKVKTCNRVHGLMIMIAVWGCQFPATWWQALCSSLMLGCRMLVFTPVLCLFLGIRTFLGPGLMYMSFMVRSFTSNLLVLVKCLDLCIYDQ